MAGIDPVLCNKYINVKWKNNGENNAHMRRIMYTMGLIYTARRQHATLEDMLKISSLNLSIRQK